MKTTTRILTYTATTLIAVLSLSACSGKTDSRVFDPKSQLLNDMLHLEVYKDFDLKPMEIFEVDLRKETCKKAFDAGQAKGLRSQREPKPFEEGKGPFFRQYQADATNIFKRKANFLMVCNNQDRIVFASYEIDAFVDAELAPRMASLVKEKLGDWNEEEGNPRVGPYSTRWNRGDNMSISVSRGWPNTTTTITYQDDLTNRALKEMIADYNHKKSNPSSKDF